MNTNECTKNLQVKFEVNGTESSGYFTKEGFLRDNSPRSSCETKETFLSIDPYNYLTRKNNKVELQRTEYQLKEAYLNLNDQLPQDIKSPFFENVNLNYPKLKNGLVEFSIDIFTIVFTASSLFLTVYGCISINKHRMIPFFENVVNSSVQTIVERIIAIETSLVHLKQNFKNNNDKLEDQLKNILHRSVEPSAPPMPFRENSIYPEVHEVNEVDEKSFTNSLVTYKEKSPYSGITCKACGFISVSNRGLNTHINAMLKRKIKSNHTKYYT